METKKVVCIREDSFLRFAENDTVGIPYALWPQPCGH